MKNDSIYVCHTYFQVYITLIKTIISKNKVDIVICSTIPEFEKLIISLKQTNLFNNIYYYDEVSILEEFRRKKIERKIFRSNQMIKLFEKNSNFNLCCYNNIYIYNDWTTIGAYLMDKKIKYHLIEDGVNAFYYIKGNLSNLETFLNPTLKYRIKKIIKKILHIGYDFFGQSKYVIDIEVNDKSKIFIKNDNVKEVPKKLLYSKINDEEKLIIYNVFINDDLNLNLNENKVLILTQPLYIDHLVNSIEEQVKIYNELIDKYIKNYEVYIKPHPRDTFNYKTVNPKINIINKNIPIEILNYNSKIHFKKAITVTSTAIESLEFVDEKIILGFEFLENR